MESNTLSYFCITWAGLKVACITYLNSNSDILQVLHYFTMYLEQVIDYVTRVTCNDLPPTLIMDPSQFLCKGQIQIKVFLSIHSTDIHQKHEQQLQCGVNDSTGNSLCLCDTCNASCLDILGCNGLFQD